jgi:arylsulfatase A-like enzyme
MTNQTVALRLMLAVGLCLCLSHPTAAQRRGQAGRGQPPNVVLIITDDQGYGDLGVHGNPKIRTPHLDRLAREGVRFRHFYVSPVCAPTRASLMTGRYNYRTGVVDTYLGRALMEPGEVTLAEMLSGAGYRTGIFGKWHLGDNYPMRAADRGFHESLTLNGGGLGQPSDLPGGESYFDPVLLRDGRPVKTRGYVSDVITDAALAFIGQHRLNPRQPFFAYLAFNAPHTPLEAPEKQYQTYRAMNLRREDFPGAERGVDGGVDRRGGHPIPPNFDAEATAKIYAMVENIDDNVGRLLRLLDELKLAENTVVIFMTDNGPQQPRYNAGLRERKGTVYEGGIRVPFFMRWPGRLAAGREVTQAAAHIDVAPTLLDLCDVRKPRPVKFDGLSLRPLLEGRGGRRVNWPGRTLFFQWHRGDVPELFRAFAARGRRYKLVQARGAGEGRQEPHAYELYDMERDPLEEHDLAASLPGAVERMKREYAAWFRDVTAGRNYAVPPRIFVGTPHENPVRLTRQDWRGPAAGWTPQSLGYWEVNVTRPGRYTVSARLNRTESPGAVRFAFGDASLSKEVPAGAESVVFEQVVLAKGVGRLECYVEQAGRQVGVRDVEVRLVD